MAESALAFYADPKNWETGKGAQRATLNGDFYLDGGSRVAGARAVAYFKLYEPAN